MDKCPVCFGDATTKSLEQSALDQISCPRCGKFRIDELAKQPLLTALANDERKIANASGWVREYPDVLVTLETVGKLGVLPTPNYGEKKRKLLEFFQRHSVTLGQHIVLDGSTMNVLVASTWCANSNEVGFLLAASISDELVEKRAGTQYRLTAKGYDYLAQLVVNPTSQIGFCAMWFDDSVNPLWDKAIEPAIRDAGYQPLRIDKKEHANRIDDEIFADIRRSRFVVADFTHGESGVRGGVYFEAGFAQGLGLHVIWICRQDVLATDKLHFDVRQFNFLEWTDENLIDFKHRLQRRIEAILGRGSWRPE